MLICPDIPPFLSTALYYIMWSRLHAPVPHDIHDNHCLPSPHPHLHSMYAPLCLSCHNNAVLYIRLALLSFLPCVFLLAPVCVCTVSIFRVCIFMSRTSATISLPVAVSPHPFPLIRTLFSKSTPLLFLHISLSSKLRSFQCMISTSCTGAFKPSPLHYNPASLRYSLPLSILVTSSFSPSTSSSLPSNICHKILHYVHPVRTRPPTNSLSTSFETFPYPTSYRITEV